MNHQGITLFELIIVWAIVGICAVFLIPSANTWVQRYRLKTAAQEIALTLRTAQLEAETKHVVHRVRFDPEGGIYFLQRNEQGMWMDEGDRHFLARGVRITEVYFPDGYAEFRPDATASSGSVTLTNLRKEERKVTLTPMAGRVRIE